MKIWFDTEFYEDGRTIDLISIGLVREDGAEYYAETDFARSKCIRSDWLVKHVLPHLTGTSAEEKPHAIIAREIMAFAGSKPEFWAYYADYDWVALCQLYGRMIDLPKGWPKYCRDLKQFADMYSVKLPAQESQAHNALNDARWARTAHIWLCDYLLEKGL